MNSTSNRLILFSTLLLFFIVAVLTSMHWLVSIDQTMISLLTNHSSTFIDRTMNAISNIGSSEVILGLTCLVIVILFLKKLWSYFFFFIFLSGGGIVLNLLLKLLFQRERPGEMSAIEVFGYSLNIQSYSFPSGHTMRSVILFIFLIYLCYHFIQSSSLKSISIFFLIVMISLVSISRIIVGAHFPSDVLAAVLVSISWFYFCIIMMQFIQKSYLNKSFY